MQKVFVVGSPSFCEDCVKNIEGQYGFQVVGAAYSKEEAALLIADLSPDILIVDADINEGGINVGEQLKKQRENIIVFIASDYSSIDLLQRAIAKGLNGIVKKPVSAAALADAAEKAKKCGTCQITDEGQSKEIFVFYAPKGGVGKTTLAVNLSGLIASQKGKNMKIAVADLDVWANVQSMLQLKGGRSIADWDLYLDNFNPEELRNYVVTHPLGFDIIPGIKRITEAGIFTAEFTSKFFEVVQNIYDLIIVDTNSTINDGTTVAFEKATRIFVIGTLEVPTLKGLNDLKEVFDLLGVSMHKIRMVLNRIPEKPDISIKEVAQLIPFPLIAKIKENPEVRVAVNRGEIYAVTHPDSEFRYEIAKLAAGIIGLEQEISQRQKGFFKFGAKRLR